MPDVHFDRYYRYDDLTRILSEFAAEFPHLVSIASLGKSYEGRDIWVATVTNTASGPDRDKPALWVDGNIHASEVSPSSACLYLLNELVGGYGTDPDITRCLDTRAFYICPRVNPDGAELALADKPRIVRSSTRPYPHDEEPLGGLVQQDIDGDGRMLMMRIPDPNGPWKKYPDEPRLLVRRDPTETGGQYYRVLTEGLIDDYDGVTIKHQRKKEGLDLNRNFPSNWRQEHEQSGSGPFPTSEPEVYNMVQFISGHPNITGGVAFHTYSGVLLRPYSHLNDESFAPEDLWTFQKIGAKGTELTGYPNVSVYHDFRYHPKEVISGVFDDWLFDHLGVFAWTVEIWSPQRQAGITDYKLIDWFREHPIEDDLKLLKWSDDVLAGAGYVDWFPFQHPQLGAIELGGWDTLGTWRNPPTQLLEHELALFPRWLIWHLLISPCREILEASVKPLGDDHYKIKLVVHNTGWLPSYITKQALNHKLVRGVICEIELPTNALIETGKRREELGQLEGRSNKPTSPSGWNATDPTEDRAKVEWTVRAPRGTVVQLRASHDRAGVVRTTVTLD
ncbi:MAG: M14 family metallopeptidase [Herpetosiphon sp.]